MWTGFHGISVCWGGSSLRLAGLRIRLTVSLTMALGVTVASAHQVTLLLFFAFEGSSANCMVGTDIDLLRAAPDDGY